MVEKGLMPVRVKLDARKLTTTEKPIAVFISTKLSNVL